MLMSEEISAARAQYLRNPAKAATVKLLRQALAELTSCLDVLDLKALTEKAQREVNRLQELQKWCNNGELAEVEAGLDRMRRLLICLESVQRATREAKSL